MIQRATLDAYLQILTGSMTRLVLQAVYFATLVNALRLSDYGVFASALALSLILSGGGAFGFTATLFRASTTRRRILGAYLSAFLAYAAGECTVLLLVGLVLWKVVLSAHLPLLPFLCVLVSEMVCWRTLDMLNTMSIGLGRYRNGIAIGVIGSGARLLAILAFAFCGDTGVATWSLFYVGANLLAAALCVALFWPRVRLRWQGRILKRRLKEALSFWAINTLQTVQIEADKLVVLWMAGDAQAGIYALSMRVIELMLVPVKTFFPPYIKSLLRSRDRFADWARSLAVEAGVGLSALALFVGAAVTLQLYPGLLGANVGRASQWFEGVPLLPMSRALLDYHRELMFAAERLATYAMVASVLAALRIGTIAAVLGATGSIAALVLPLNGLAALFYVISATVVWGLVIRPPFVRRIGARLSGSAGQLRTRWPGRLSPPPPAPGRS